MIGVKTHAISLNPSDNSIIRQMEELLPWFLMLSSMMPNDHERPINKRLAFGFLLLMACAGLYLTFLIARPFLTPIITAASLAVAIQPLFTYLLRFVRKRSAAALFATAAVFLALLLPAVFL